MKDKKIIIAIDGFSSTGKSTFAKKIASMLNYLYIDTGAIYRAVTLDCLQEDIIKSVSPFAIDMDRLVERLSCIRIDFTIESPSVLLPKLISVITISTALFLKNFNPSSPSLAANILRHLLSKATFSDSNATSSSSTIKIVRLPNGSNKSGDIVSSLNYELNIFFIIKSV